MSRPTLRVLSALELLQARGRLSGAELAERLGVDRRTVRRYIAKLEELGIPLMAEQGRDGGYRLIPGYKLPPLMFSDDEALALSVGLIAARGLGLAEAAPAVASAQAKLERVMPDALRQRVAAMHETVRVEMSRPVAALDNAVLVTLSQAAQQRQRVHLSYRTPQLTDSERDFDPYGLLYHSGRWYVAGHCHLRRELRSFRLDRVRSVRAIEAYFGRPERFDVLAYLRDSIARLPRDHAVEVRLHTDLATAQRELFYAFGLLECLDDGGVLLRSQTENLDWYARELARLPFGFEVVRPLALKDSLARLGQRLTACAVR